MTVFERVRQTAADLFHLAPEKITPQSSPEQIESWDSVEHLNLVLALETQFDLQFEPEEFDRMNTIGEIAALVEAKLE